MATNGLVVMTPTSIAYSGTSASINADGSVVFSACTSLSLNGVFTSDYDNYMVAWRGVHSASDVNLQFRLRASGVDEDSASNYYTWQYLQASSTTVNAARTTANEADIATFSSTQRDGLSLYLFGPQLAQPTAGRSVTVTGRDSARVLDVAFTHSLSTSYDGFTGFLASGSMTGLLTVFGFNQ